MFHLQRLLLSGVSHRLTDGRIEIRADHSICEVDVIEGGIRGRIPLLRKTFNAAKEIAK